MFSTKMILILTMAWCDAKFPHTTLESVQYNSLCKDMMEDCIVSSKPPASFDKCVEKKFWEMQNWEYLNEPADTF